MPGRTKVFRLIVVVCLLTLIAPIGHLGITKAAQTPSSNVVTGSVKDSLGRAMSEVEVTLQAKGGAEIAKTRTDERGRFTLQGISGGTYVLLARKKGFKPATKIVVSAQRTPASLELVLESEQALTVAVEATQLHAQNGLTSAGANKYTMTSKDITNLPEGAATPLNEVVLQMPGVALDQNQEIHIRGEHAGIQYQMNGIMLPLDINNDPTFTQLLNTHFVKSVSLIDGILPAQYGYRLEDGIAGKPLLEVPVVVWPGLRCSAAHRSVARAY